MFIILLIWGLWMTHSELHKALRTAHKALFSDGNSERCMRTLCRILAQIFVHKWVSMVALKQSTFSDELNRGSLGLSFHSLEETIACFACKWHPRKTAETFLSLARSTAATGNVKKLFIGALIKLLRIIYQKDLIYVEDLQYFCILMQFIPVVVVSKRSPPY